jgi:trimeric autotransporter adhesin
MELRIELPRWKALLAALVTCWSACGGPQPALYAASSPGWVIEWGYDTFAGAAVPATLVSSNAVAVSAGTFHRLALKNDATVAGWGANFAGQASGDMASGPNITNATVRINHQVLSNAVAIAAGREFSLAIRADGTAVTWGQNYVPAGLTNLIAIAAGWGASWVLKTDGTVEGWMSRSSDNTQSQALPVIGLSNVVAIAAGSSGHYTRGVALKRDGSVGCWGGQTIYSDAAPPPGLTDVVAITAGDNHSLALRRDGTVIGWGFNDVGQATGIPTTNSPCIFSGPVMLGGVGLRNVVSVAAYGNYSMALKRNGTVVAWGKMVNNLYPATVPDGLSNVVAIAAGDSFCLAITTNKAIAERFQRK